MNHLELYKKLKEFETSNFQTQVITTDATKAVREIAAKMYDIELSSCLYHQWEAIIAICDAITEINRRYDQR